MILLHPIVVLWSLQAIPPPLDPASPPPRSPPTPCIALLSPDFHLSLSVISSVHTVKIIDSEDIKTLLATYFLLLWKLFFTLHGAILEHSAHIL